MSIFGAFSTTRIPPFWEKHLFAVESQYDFVWKTSQGRGTLENSTPSLLHWEIRDNRGPGTEDFGQEYVAMELGITPPTVLFF